MKMILCILICLLLACPACAEGTAFAPGEPHTYTLDFGRWFETMSAEIDACTLSIQQKIYDETQATALMDQIEKDILAIRELTGAQLQPHTVYVAETLFHGIQRFENRVYCQAEDILSGEYMEYLAAASLGLEERWKAIGVSGCISGEAEKIDRAALAEFYCTAENMDMLSLFGAYFSEEFCPDEQRETAVNTAHSLTEYILMSHGFDALARENCDLFRQEWLDDIGVDREYTDPYAGWFEGCTWETSKKYPLIIMTKKGDTFYLKPLPGDMETPQEVRAFMHEAMYGPKALIEGLRLDAPEYADYMEKNFTLPIKYYIESSEDQYSYANWSLREIHLGLTGTVIHETMHVLTRVYAKAVGYYMDQWKVEGIAEYLTLKYWPSTGQKEALFRELTEFDCEPNADDTERDTAVKQAVRIIRELYQEKNGIPASVEEMNAYEYVLASAKADQLTDWDWKSVGDAFNSLNSKNVSQRFVNGLTYNEVFSFTDYLIRTYSLDKFLAFCMGDAFFEEAYGLTYEEALEGWQTDLLGEE